MCGSASRQILRKLRMTSVGEGDIQTMSLRMFLASQERRAQNSTQSGENNESNQGADQAGCKEQDDSLGRFEEFHGLLGLRVWIASGGLFDYCDQFGAYAIPGVE